MALVWSRLYGECLDLSSLDGRHSADPFHIIESDLSHQPLRTYSFLSRLTSEEPRCCCPISQGQSRRGEPRGLSECDQVEGGIGTKALAIRILSFASKQTP